MFSYDMWMSYGRDRFRPVVDSLFDAVVVLRSIECSMSKWM